MHAYIPNDANNFMVYFVLRINPLLLRQKQYYQYPMQTHLFVRRGTDVTMSIFYNCDVRYVHK